MHLNLQDHTYGAAHQSEGAILGPTQESIFVKGISHCLVVIEYNNIMNA